MRRSGVILVVVIALLIGVMLWTRMRESDSEQLYLTVRPESTNRTTANDEGSDAKDTTVKDSTDAVEDAVGKTTQRIPAEGFNESDHSKQNTDEEEDPSEAIRRTFSAFLEAGKLGDTFLAESISVPGSAVPKQIVTDFPEILPLEPLDILGMAANDQSAWMVTTPILSRDADHEREGFLTITLNVMKPDGLLMTWIWRSRTG